MNSHHLNETILMTAVSVVASQGENGNSISHQITGHEPKSHGLIIKRGMKLLCLSVLRNSIKVLVLLISRWCLLKILYKVATALILYWMYSRIS